MEGVDLEGLWARRIAGVVAIPAMAAVAWVSIRGSDSLAHGVVIVLVLLVASAGLVRLTPPPWAPHRAGRTYFIPCLTLAFLAAWTREIARAAGFYSPPLAVVSAGLTAWIWAIATLGMRWTSRRDLALTQIWLAALAPSLAWILASCSNILLDTNPRRILDTHIVRKWEKTSRQSFGQKFVQIQDLDIDSLNYLRIDGDLYARVTAGAEVKLEIAPGLFACPWVCKLTLSE